MARSGSVAPASCRLSRGRPALGLPETTQNHEGERLALTDQSVDPRSRQTASNGPVAPASCRLSRGRPALGLPETTKNQACSYREFIGSIMDTRDGREARPPSKNCMNFLRSEVRRPTSAFSRRRLGSGWVRGPVCRHYAGVNRRQRRTGCR